MAGSFGITDFEEVLDDGLDGNDIVYDFMGGAAIPGESRSSQAPDRPSREMPQGPRTRAPRESQQAGHARRRRTAKSRPSDGELLAEEARLADTATPEAKVDGSLQEARSA